MSETIDKYYHKGYKNLDKLHYKLLEKGYDIKKSDVRKYLDSKTIKHRVKRYNKSLMGNKFSTAPNSWQMDTYTTEKYKTNYLLLININTRYVWCCKREAMTTEDFIENISKFITEYHPQLIECDYEKSFTSYKSVQFLRKHNIVLRTFPAKMDHASLSIMNSFCRKLRIESRDSEGDADIEHIVKIHNKSYNKSIGMTPRAMQANPDYEYRYIYNQFQERDAKEQLALKDKIEKGDRVRYIRDEDRGVKKFAKDIMKHQLSKYYYIVEQVHSPFSFDIIAEDGSVKTVPRYRLFKLTKSEEKLLSFAPTIEDANIYQIFDEILDYEPKFYKSGELNPDRTRYKVRIITRTKAGDKKKDIYYYSPMQLRADTPTHPTTLEMEFLRKNAQKYRLSKDSAFIVPILK